MRGLSVMRLSRTIRSNVDRQLSSNGRGRESGAVARIVAMFFGFGVLLGIGALVIDTGSLLYERRQLQSGADAAALSVAQTCAATPSAPCAVPGISAGSPLVALAGANAADQKSDIASVCGSIAVGFPTVCPTPGTPGLVDCPATSTAGRYVEVRTSTRSGNGASTILPPSLAQALSGGSYSGETVKACARVAWGNATVAPTLFPVTFSYCDWLAASGANPAASPPVPGNYQPPPADRLNPGYGVAPPNTPWPGAGSEITLYTAGHGSPASCPTWNGHVAPGNFGTLDNSGCTATVVNGWVSGDTGNSIPCNKNTLGSMVGTVIYVPIFDCASQTNNSLANCTSAHGSHDYYHISGYAAFYLTGFYFSGSGSTGDSIYPPDNGHSPCNGNDRCVSGWFTTDTLQTTIDQSGAPGFGTSTVQVTG